MATNLPSLKTPQSLFASIDMGTNSFKLLIICAYPNGKFFTVDCLKESVVLGRDVSSCSLISDRSLSRSLESLRAFKDVIQSHRIAKDHTRAFATAAVREAENKKEFLERVEEKIGFEVDVLSREEEARFGYLGVLQFLPVYDKLVLSVDIGGGSTEFVIGKGGKIVFWDSLKLGHVSLTEKFVTCSGSRDEVLRMKEYIRLVIRESGLIEKVKEFGFELVVGCSGTIRAIEKAVFNGYYQDFVDNVGVFGDSKRHWRLSRGELRNVVERLCCGGEGEKVRKERFFKRRSEFIVAGAVLLEEIFELLGIEEMEISGYGLAEGVIADSLSKVFDGYDLHANARWQSVVRLAMSFNNKKRIKAAAECAGIAKEIFEGLRKCDDLHNDQVKLIASLDDKDLEYLEAACLLHSIGLLTSKKGYHKQSYHIITNGDHLYGYSTEEIKTKEKFRILCTIMRLSVTLQQNASVNLQEMKFLHSHGGFSLVINKATDQSYLPVSSQSRKEEIETELGKELEYFKMVFKQELLIMVPSSSSNDLKDQFNCERDVDHVQF